MLPIPMLLSMLPTVIGLFKDPSKEKVLSAGMAAVKAVTGLEPPSNASGLEAEIKNLSPEQQAKIIELMLKKEDVKKEIEQAWLENTKDARKMYRESDHKTADSLAERIMKWNLPVIVALVIVNIIAVVVLKEHSQLIAIISNFIGIAIGQLFNERQAVVNFFFGSSKSSRDKDAKNG